MFGHILVYCNAKRGGDASVRHAVDLADAAETRISFRYLTQFSSAQKDRAPHTEDKVEGVGEDDDAFEAITEEMDAAQCTDGGSENLLDRTLH